MEVSSTKKRRLLSTLEREYVGIRSERGTTNRILPGGGGGGKLNG